MVVAETKPAEPPPVAPPPPAVVTVTPAPAQPTVTQGQSTLVLPANPSEMVVAPPALRDKIASASVSGVTPRATTWVPRQTRGRRA